MTIVEDRAVLQPFAGRARRGVSSHRVGETRSPSLAPSRASASRGAEKYATATETTTSTAAIDMLCQRKIVCVSGITPVIGSSAGGIDDFVACSSAADDERPSAQTLPSPR